MTIKRDIIFACIGIFISIAALGQVTKRTCKAHENHLKLLKNDAVYAARRADIGTPTPSQVGKKRTAETLYTIPVVVHIIHNGEAEGSGANIPNSQITSAITALTEDFRSTNSDTLASGHAFYSLQADVGIDFCLAQEDTLGNPTTGIVRYNKGQSGWEATDFDANVKPATIWDITKYLNIWITTFSGADDQTLGYATFPGSTKPSEVGVVIGSTFFGTEGPNLSATFNKNRTLTHEVGHFFNLFHIWGDATCGDDLVSDTPIQQNPNTEICPTFPHNVGSICTPGPNGEMYMNYMDYTTDVCMQLFSIGQKDRMRAALQFSDRIGLTTSNKCPNPSSTLSVSGDKFHLYPNPSTNTTTISIPDNFDLTSINIYNLSGQEMNLNYNIEGGNVAINTSSLSNGTYIVTIYGDSGTAHKNLVILK